MHHLTIIFYAVHVSGLGMRLYVLYCTSHITDIPHTNTVQSRSMVTITLSLSNDNKFMSSNQRELIIINAD